MRVQDVMKKAVVTIEGTEAADRAFETMRSKRIRHLVVTDGSGVEGILSERDLGPEPNLWRGRTVADLMTAHAVVANPEMPLRSAANLMRGRTVGCLPVVDDGRLIGIVTVSDLLALVERGSGGKEAGTGRRTLKARGPRVKPLIARRQA